VKEETMLEAIPADLLLEPLKPRSYYHERLSNDTLTPLDGRLDPYRFMLPHLVRDAYIQDYGFAILTRETADELISLTRGRKVLDAGSGSGYIAKVLHDAGVDVTAVDSGTGSYGFKTCWKRDIEADAATLLPGDYDVVLLSWPCYGATFAHEVISAMRTAQTLVFQGEGIGGCTANDAFFDDLRKDWFRQDEWSDALNQGHVQFHGLHDRWSVHVKRSKAANQWID
jgi:SAM-dependent methyltransferase